MIPAPLLALTTTDPWLAAPSRCHRDLPGIIAATQSWARQVGLDHPASAALPAFAGRCFPETRVADVALFAQWLTWVFHFDDELDEGPLGRDTAGVERICGRLLDAVGNPLGDTSASLSGFTGLWHATIAGTSPAWRKRFVTDFAIYLRGVGIEAGNRRTGHVPTPAAYPLLRRWIAGPFMFDLMEPVLGVEVPVALTRTETWRTLVDGAIDVVAWSNDVASVAKETTHGDVHNYVVVVGHHMGMDTAAATDWVLTRIRNRLHHMHAAAHVLPSLLRRLSPSQARAASKVACGFLAAPRAHLDWLCESPRYAIVPTALS